MVLLILSVMTRLRCSTRGASVPVVVALIFDAELAVLYLSEEEFHREPPLEAGPVSTCGELVPAG